MILAIETSSSNCSVAIFDNYNIIGTISINGRNVHDKLLAETSKQLLNFTNINIDEIKYISVNIGPGSFTGLRIGLSFAKGLIFGKDAKLIASSSNDIQFFSFDKNLLSNNFTKIATLIAAGNDNYYYKLFQISDNKRLDELQLISFDELAKKIDEHTLIIGQINEAIKMQHPNSISKELSSIDQINLAKFNIENEIFADLKSIKPLYLNEVNYKINN